MYTYAFTRKAEDKEVVKSLRLKNDFILSTYMYSYISYYDTLYRPRHLEPVKTARVGLLEAPKSEQQRSNSRLGSSLWVHFSSKTGNVAINPELGSCKLVSAHPSEEVRETEFDVLLAHRALLLQPKYAQSI